MNFNLQQLSKKRSLLNIQKWNRKEIEAEATKEMIKQKRNHQEENIMMKGEINMMKINIKGVIIKEKVQ